jgi:hypothetical protein
MIRYDLICDQQHEFDSWFSDSAAYDAQVKRELVECPYCGSTAIAKQMMAPNVGAKSNRKDSQRQSLVAAAPTDPQMQKMLQMMREVRAHVENNADYVGHKFAAEARKIHYKESEERGIYGEATQAEAEALIEEGIEVAPLPRLPEDGN